MNELALFAGAGGGILGGHLLGWRCVCAVEFDPHARDVLLARQNDGCLPPFPVWDDVRTFDGKPWRGIVDVVSGGFPCQDISAAGKGAGITGERSGLWKEMARIIGEVRPRFVLVENSPMLVSRGLGVVLADLAAMGFDARWGIVGAHHASAPHKRDRIWILANSNGRYGRTSRTDKDQIISTGLPFRAGKPNSEMGVLAYPEIERGRAGLCKVEQEQNGDKPANGGCDVCHTEEPGMEGTEPEGHSCAAGCTAEHGSWRRQTDWWQSEPDVGRVAHGVASRVDRLRCLGNGQVPAVVRIAWDALTKGLT